MTANADDLEAAIEASIDAGGDDPAAFLVYADWLQSRGDPRGELIVFQHRRATREADELLETRRDLFLGPFAEFATDRVRDPKSHPDRRRILDVEWQLGFIHAAHIGWQPSTRKRIDDVAAQLREFLELPSCRFLKHLKLGPIPATRGMDFRPLLEVLVATGKPRTLRSLFAGDRGHFDLADTATGPVGDVLATFPRLRHLNLTAGRVRIGAIDHAELRGFGVHTVRLDRIALDDIASAVWPRLDRLELTLGDGDCQPRDLAPLLSGASLPALRHLAVVECAFSDALVGALAGSKLLPRLVSLDLSRGTLTDAGVRAMAAARLAFAHLEWLDIEHNPLTDASTPLLRGLARKLTTSL